MTEDDHEERILSIYGGEENIQNLRLLSLREIYEIQKEKTTGYLKDMDYHPKIRAIHERNLEEINQALANLDD